MMRWTLELLALIRAVQEEFLHFWNLVSEECPKAGRRCATFAGLGAKWTSCPISRDLAEAFGAPSDVGKLVLGAVSLDMLDSGTQRSPTSFAPLGPRGKGGSLARLST